MYALNVGVRCRQMCHLKHSILQVKAQLQGRANNIVIALNFCDIANPQSVSSQISSPTVTQLGSRWIRSRETRMLNTSSQRQLLNPRSRLIQWPQAQSLQTAYFHSDLGPKHKVIKPKFRHIWPEYRSSEDMEKSDWMTIDNFRVYPWALSGLESCVLVESQDFNIAFDMGYAYKEAVKCEHVFISHGHHDHVSGIVHHALKRNLYGMKQATYHVPPHLVEPLTSIAQGFAQMHENDEALANIRLKPVSVGETIQLPGGVSVKPFPTEHRVVSQGYIVYKTKKALKAEFNGQDGKDIGKLIRQGVNVHDVTTTPLVAYTGDTIFDVFKAPDNPDLLKVKLLITETTYIDDELDKQGRYGVERARDRGHCHIQEFVDNQHLFKNVPNILFIHFSDKYSLGYIKEKVKKLVPEGMMPKVHLGLLMKEKFK